MENRKWSGYIKKHVLSNAILFPTLWPDVLQLFLKISILFVRVCISQHQASLILKSKK